jgi:hypothetical protein
MTARLALGRTRAAGGSGTVPDGVAGRWIALSSALVGGIVLAILLTAQFAPWTAHGALAHHHPH